MCAGGVCGEGFVCVVVFGSEFGLADFCASGWVTLRPRSLPNHGELDVEGCVGASGSRGGIWSSPRNAVTANRM